VASAQLVLQSLNLLDELGLTVMTLDGREPYRGGQRVDRTPPAAN
jgi:hypothetical protein